uniref:Protein kinase domain-containing protein n=1 Tax=Globisporangium ultimum (strain ATCC 200006 / CBS 805.95 / DAOM BR144) TaxID=431595 RepID=K3WYL3_GLOUD
MASTVPDGSFQSSASAVPSTSQFSPSQDKQSELTGSGSGTTPIANMKDPQYSPQKTTSVTGASPSNAVVSTGMQPDTYSFVVSGTTFQIDLKYKFLKPIGHGAYGVVISAENSESKDKVAIKKISKAFEDIVDAKRILREIKLLQHFDHENVITIVDLLPPATVTEFEDVYIISDLMETDLHRIIYSRQPLTDDHIQYFLYQLYPTTNPTAIDLLERMLVFDPAKRISVEEALAHPYLDSLHNADDEPVADSSFSFDFEKEELTKMRLQELIFDREICKFHPEAQFVHSSVGKKLSTSSSTDPIHPNDPKLAQLLSPSQFAHLLPPNSNTTSATEG